MHLACLELVEQVLCAVQLASAKTAECRAKLDLKLHFCPATLDEPVRVPLLHADLLLGAALDLR